MLFPNKLGGYIGKEELATEFKEVCLKMALDLYMTKEEAEEIILKKIWNPKLSIAIQDTLEIYIRNIFPKYLSSFSCSNINGTLYFGVHDHGEITGVPFMGIIDKKWFIKTIENVLDNNIRGDEKKNILENINIEYEKLEIYDMLIEDEHSFLYNKYKNEQLNINNLKLEYNEKKVSWLLELSKYSRKLTEVLNSTESRFQMIEYIEERKDMFEDEKDMNKIIDLLKKEEYIPIPDFDELQIRKKNKNDILYWLVTFKDYYTDKISKKRPTKPVYYRSYGPLQIISKLSLMRSIFSKINGVNYYLIKININGEKIKDIYYKYNNEWIKKIRLLSDDGTPYSE